MAADLQQLVDDAVELTGAPRPELLRDDAPVLDEQALIDSDAGPVYLVGLIGGKDVGKSSLVNAIVGQEITARSSFGEGTGGVIAYAHEDAADELRVLLEREVPGRYRIVTHRVPGLRRQVLLDLPDIDSHWLEHVQITRRMLRHLLYPLWIQSVEKYADQQPQTLLRQVAAGNDPANFLFVLNKADQIKGPDPFKLKGSGPFISEGEELREDFAQRIARSLELAQPPRVYLISALDRDAHDLPELRRALSTERPAPVVEQGVQLAGRRRQRSLLAWLDQQNLPQRAARSERLLREAQELLAARVGVPLMEQAIPRLANDPAQRLWLVEPAMNARLGRWPIVNVIQTAMSPLVALVRRNLGPTSAVGAAPAGSAPGAVASIDPFFAMVTGRSLATLVQTTFAQLRQTDPVVAALYAHRRLWDDAPAEHAAGELSRRLADAVQRQRDAAVSAVSGGATGALTAPLRWLLTIGAVLWFPLVQPVLERALVDGFLPHWRDLAKLIVPLLGASYLLHSAAFLLIYFAVLWLVLRWSTNRKVARLSRRWASADLDSDLSLAGQVARWMDELLEPIRRDHERAAAIVQRVEAAAAGQGV